MNLLPNSVINGDCLEVMKEIGDASIDMILCDLPYGATQNKWDTIIPLALPPYHPQMTIGEKNHTKGKAVGKQAEDVHSNRSYGDYTLVESPDTNLKYPASIWRFSKPHPSVALHATEKPIELLRYAIRTYTDEGAIVLDNCCGTGSTLIAAKLEGRKYIGIDNGVCDKKKSPYFGLSWAQVAQIRLEAIDNEFANEPKRYRPMGAESLTGICAPA